MLDQQEPRSAVKNAADARQVKKSKSRAKLDRQQQMLDLEWVLKQPQGRRVLWRLLGHTGMFKSVWEPSAKIHFNAGKQDYGLWLWSECEQSSLDHTLQMQREHSRKESEDV